MLSVFKKLQGDISNRFTGKTDLLEAVCAGVALIASADGSVDDAEITTALKAMGSNKTLTAAFQTNQIERTLDTMLARANGGRSGRAGLYKEIDEVASQPDAAEAVMYAILDVADDNGIDDKEMEVAKNIAQRLRLDLNKFL